MSPVRVEQGAVRVVRSPGGTPATVRTQARAARVVRSGVPGPTGPAGRSAYEEWLAVGHTGDRAAFLASLVGPGALDQFLPATAGYPAQTVAERLTAFIAALEDARTAGGTPTQEAFTLPGPGAFTVTLAHRPRPGTLAVYLSGARQFDLSDVPSDGQTYQFPASWNFIPGEPLVFVYAY